MLVAKKEKPEEQVALFRQIYETLALYIIMNNKQQNVKEVKLLFKELFHCMRVLSENEGAHRLFFASPEKMSTFCQLMKSCLETVQIQKTAKMELVEE